MAPPAIWRQTLSPSNLRNHLPGGRKQNEAFELIVSNSWFLLDQWVLHTVLVKYIVHCCISTCKCTVGFLFLDVCIGDTPHKRPHVSLPPWCLWSFPASRWHGLVPLRVWLVSLPVDGTGGKSNIVAIEPQPKYIDFTISHKIGCLWWCHSDLITLIWIDLEPICGLRKQCPQSKLWPLILRKESTS